MKCLLKYQWVKLPRNQLPPGKGIMGMWARLAFRAAFRNGTATYCGYLNSGTAGAFQSWGISAIPWMQKQKNLPTK